MQSRKKPIKTMKNQSEPIENKKKICKNQKNQKKTIFWTMELIFTARSPNIVFFLGLFFVFYIVFFSF
jgi:hypothetical protein